MTKKTALTILVIIIALALIVVGYFSFFYKTTSNNGETQKPNFFENFFGGFFSTNNNNETTQDNNDNNGQEGSVSETIIPKLRQISNVPSAGIISFERETSGDVVFDLENKGRDKELVFRYVERATGHIYETTARDLRVTRVTNTTIPKIYSAIFSNDGESVVLTYAEGEVIQNYVGKIIYPVISTSTEEQENTQKSPDDNLAKLVGNSLIYDSFGLAKSPSDSLFFLNTTDDANFVEKTEMNTVSFKNPNSIKRITSTYNSEWLTNWFKDDTISLVTKPSGLEDGQLFYLKPSTGEIRKIIGGALGLMALPNPDGDRVLLSENLDGSILTTIYNTETKELFDLNIRTLVGDKCVWSKKDTKTAYCAAPSLPAKGNFPDDWYKGLVYFNDDLWQINVDTGKTDLLMQSNSQTDQDLDILDLSLSPEEDYLIFKNKSDATYWSLDIFDESLAESEATTTDSQ